MWVEYESVAGHPRIDNEVGRDPTDEANKLGAAHGTGRVGATCGHLSGKSGLPFAFGKLRRPTCAG